MDSTTVTVAVVVAVTLPLLLNGLRKKLFRWPDLQEIEDQNVRPMINNNNNKTTTTTDADSEVIIYGFEAPGDYPSYRRGNVDSPYVARVEAFCRLHSIRYEKRAAKPTDNPNRSKLPFASIKGKMVDDSTRIIETLRQKYQLQDKDEDDSKKQQQQQALAQARLIRQSLFGSLYFVQLHHMFETPQGRDVFVNYKRQRLPPFPVSEIVLSKIFWNQRNNLKGSGIGRLPHDEIVKLGQDDLRCLSVLLGSDRYFFGSSQPTDIDADAYAFLAFSFWDDTQCVHEWIQDIQQELPNLVAFAERMRQHLYPELGTTIATTSSSNGHNNSNHMNGKKDN